MKVKIAEKVRNKRLAKALREKQVGKKKKKKKEMEMDDLSPVAVSNNNNNQKQMLGNMQVTQEVSSLFDGLSEEGLSAELLEFRDKYDLIKERSRRLQQAKKEKEKESTSPVKKTSDKAAPVNEAHNRVVKKEPIAAVKYLDLQDRKDTKDAPNPVAIKTQAKSKDTLPPSTSSLVNRSKSVVSTGKDSDAEDSVSKQQALDALLQITGNELHTMTKHHAPVAVKTPVTASTPVSSSSSSKLNIQPVSTTSVVKPSVPTGNIVKITETGSGLVKYQLRNESLEEQGLTLVYTAPPTAGPVESDNVLYSSYKPRRPGRPPAADVEGKEGKGKKPGRHVCQFCGRRCTKPSVLKKHIRSHTGERPYPCVPCGFWFKTKSNLYKHCKSHAHAIKAGLTPNSEDGGKVPEYDEENDSEETESEDEGQVFSPGVGMPPGVGIPPVSPGLTPIMSPGCVASGDSHHRKGSQSSVMQVGQSGDTAAPKVKIERSELRQRLERRISINAQNESLRELSAQPIRNIPLIDQQQRLSLDTTKVKQEVASPPPIVTEITKSTDDVVMSVATAAGTSDALKSLLPAEVAGFRIDMETKRAVPVLSTQLSTTQSSAIPVTSTITTPLPNTPATPGQLVIPVTGFNIVKSGGQYHVQIPVQGVVPDEALGGVTSSSYHPEALTMSQTPPIDASNITKQQLPVSKESVQERIQQLINQNEAIVDTATLDSVKPRRTGLYRRDSTSTPPRLENASGEVVVTAGELSKPMITGMPTLVKESAAASAGITTPTAQIPSTSYSNELSLQKLETPMNNEVKTTQPMVTAQQSLEGNLLERVLKAPRTSQMPDLAPISSFPVTGYPSPQMGDRSLPGVTSTTQAMRVANGTATKPTGQQYHHSSRSSSSSGGSNTIKNLLQDRKLRLAGMNSSSPGGVIPRQMSVDTAVQYNPLWQQQQQQQAAGGSVMSGAVMSGAVQMAHPGATVYVPGGPPGGIYPPQPYRGYPTAEDVQALANAENRIMNRRRKYKSESDASSDGGMASPPTKRKGKRKREMPGLALISDSNQNIPEEENPDGNIPPLGSPHSTSSPNAQPANHPMRSPHMQHSNQPLSSPHVQLVNNPTMSSPHVQLGHQGMMPFAVHGIHHSQQVGLLQTVHQAGVNPTNVNTPASEVSVIQHTNITTPSHTKPDVTPLRIDAPPRQLPPHHLQWQQYVGQHGLPGPMTQYSPIPRSPIPRSPLLRSPLPPRLMSPLLSPRTHSGLPQQVSDHQRRSTTPVTAVPTPREANTTSTSDCIPTAMQILAAVANHSLNNAQSTASLPTQTLTVASTSTGPVLSTGNSSPRALLPGPHGGISMSSPHQVPIPGPPGGLSSPRAPLPGPPGGLSSSRAPLPGPSGHMMGSPRAPFPGPGGMMSMPSVHVRRPDTSTSMYSHPPPRLHSPLRRSPQQKRIMDYSHLKDERLDGSLDNKSVSGPKRPKLDLPLNSSEPGKKMPLKRPGSLGMMSRGHLTLDIPSPLTDLNSPSKRPEKPMMRIDPKSLLTPEALSIASSVMRLASPMKPNTPTTPVDAARELGRLMAHAFHNAGGKVENLLTTTQGQVCLGPIATPTSTGSKQIFLLPSPSSSQAPSAFGSLTPSRSPRSPRTPAGPFPSSSFPSSPYPSSPFPSSPFPSSPRTPVAPFPSKDSRPPILSKESRPTVPVTRAPLPSKDTRSLLSLLPSSESIPVQRPRFSMPMTKLQPHRLALYRDSHESEDQIDMCKTNRAMTMSSTPRQPLQFASSSTRNQLLTQGTYCCLRRSQPMYVQQGSNVKISMYSNWKAGGDSHHPLGMSWKAHMALYNSGRNKKPKLSFIFSDITPPKFGIVTQSGAWKPEQMTLKVETRPPNTPKLPPQTPDATSPPPSDISATHLLEQKVKEKKHKDHHGRKHGSHRIPIFKGGFKSNENYEYVRGRGRGKYVCEECGIRCKKPSMLKKHIRTHTDMRPYQCRICNFAFKTKGNLTKHMKSKAHNKKCLENGITPGEGDLDQSYEDDDPNHQFSDADDDNEDTDSADGDTSDDESELGTPISTCSSKDPIMMFPIRERHSSVPNISELGDAKIGEGMQRSLSTVITQPQSAGPLQRTFDDVFDRPRRNSMPAGSSAISESGDIDDRLEDDEDEGQNREIESLDRDDDRPMKLSRSEVVGKLSRHLTNRHQAQKAAAAAKDQPFTTTFDISQLPSLHPGLLHPSTQPMNMQPPSVFPGQHGIRSSSSPQQPPVLDKLGHIAIITPSAGMSSQYRLSTTIQTPVSSSAESEAPSSSTSPVSITVSTPATPVTTVGGYIGSMVEPSGLQPVPIFIRKSPTTSSNPNPMYDNIPARFSGAASTSFPRSEAPVPRPQHLALNPANHPDSLRLLNHAAAHQGMLHGTSHPYGVPLPSPADNRDSANSFTASLAHNAYMKARTTPAPFAAQPMLTPLHLPPGTFNRDGSPRHIAPPTVEPISDDEDEYNRRKMVQHADKTPRMMSPTNRFTWDHQPQPSNAIKQLLLARQWPGGPEPQTPLSSFSSPFLPPSPSVTSMKTIPGPVSASGNHHLRPPLVSPMLPSNLSQLPATILSQIRSPTHLKSPSRVHSSSPRPSPSPPENIPFVPPVARVKTPVQDQARPLLSPKGKSESSGAVEAYEEEVYTSPTQGGNHKCSVCSQVFMKPNQLRIHIRTHSDEEQTFRCYECSIEFRSRSLLAKHERSELHLSKVEAVELPVPGDSDPRPFKCKLCQVAFRIRGHMAKHLRSRGHIASLERVGGAHPNFKHDPIMVDLLNENDVDDDGKQPASPTESDKTDSASECGDHHAAESKDTHNNPHVSSSVNTGTS